MFRGIVRGVQACASCQTVSHLGRGPFVAKIAPHQRRGLGNVPNQDFEIVQSNHVLHRGLWRQSVPNGQHSSSQPTLRHNSNRRHRQLSGERTACIHRVSGDGHTHQGKITHKPAELTSPVETKMTNPGRCIANCTRIGT